MVKMTTSERGEDAKGMGICESRHPLAAFPTDALSVQPNLTMALFEDYCYCWHPQVPGLPMRLNQRQNREGSRSHQLWT